MYTLEDIQAVDMEVAQACSTSTPRRFARSVRWAS